MSEKLEIKKEYKVKVLELKLSGRLDAHSSTLLSEQLEEEIRAGHYDICLDLEKINYISSAGIRVLVKYYKQLKSVSGLLFISKISAEARSVLEMVGLSDLLKDRLTLETIERTEEESYKANGIVYERSRLDDHAMLHCSICGDPKRIHSSDFSDKDLKTEKFSKNRYGIGFGAFGNNFEDCKKRFGEFIAIGDSIAYLPSDGSNTPDYSIKSGKLIPEISMLYGIIFDGTFSDLFTFKPESDSSGIGFSKLINDVSGFAQLPDAGYLMIAETSGIIGASFQKAPTELNPGYSPFRFPEIREYINFTTEPEYGKMLTVTTGISMKDPPDKYKKILRPLSEKLRIWGHFHTAIFYFHPIGKKDIDINETVVSLYETDKIQHVTHLINDERYITGIGESEFVHGRIWAGPLDLNFKEKKEE